MVSRLLLCLLLATAAVLAAGCASLPGSNAATPAVPTTGAPLVDADPATVLAAIVADVNTTLGEMDTNIATAAAELGRSGLSGPDANASLERVAAFSPHVADALSIDPQGQVVAAMPVEYTRMIGTSLANQTHVQEALKDRRPAISPIFTATEGFDAAVLQHPVTGADGSFTGLVSVAFDPSMLLADRIDRAVSGTTLTAWAMQPDGRVLFDPDLDEIGKNVFTDPSYAAHSELRELAQRMATEPVGTGTYTFTATGGGPVVTKQATWGTAGIHETGWRVVVVREG